MSQYSKGIIWWPVLILSMILGGLLLNLNAQMHLQSRLLAAAWELTQDRALAKMAFLELEQQLGRPSALKRGKFHDNVSLLKEGAAWKPWPQSLLSGRVVQYAFQILPSEPNLGQLSLRIGTTPQVDQLVAQAYGDYCQGAWHFGPWHEVWR